MKTQSTFSYDAPEDSPGFLLWRTTIAWQRLIKKALAPFDLSHAQFVIMTNVKWFLEHEKNPTQIDIATLSGLDKMTISKSLKKLATLELVTRTESQQDTRAKNITLTAKGHLLIEKLIPIVEDIDKNFFGVITQSEQTDLINAFSHLISK